MQLKDLGEKKIIQEFIMPLFNEPKPGVVVDIGDDACIVEISKDLCLVITIDKIFEKPMSLCCNLMDFKDIGYFLVTTNISDIISMGGEPRGLVISTAFPADFDYEKLKQFFHGVKEAATDYGISIWGGDLGEASKISFVGSAVGIIKKTEILRRSTAKIGDIAFATGYPGLFLTAFKYFTEAKKKGLTFSESEENFLSHVIKKPLAHIKEVNILKEYHSCTSLMDNTDGLVASAREIALASNVSIFLDKSKIPIHVLTLKVSDFLKKDPMDFVLPIAGEFELFGTLNPQTNIQEIKEKMKISAVGKVISKDKYPVYIGENIEGAKPIKARGWEHFIKDKTNGIKSK